MQRESFYGDLEDRQFFFLRGFAVRSQGNRVILISDPYHWPVRLILNKPFGPFSLLTSRGYQKTAFNSNRIFHDAVILFWMKTGNAANTTHLSVTSPLDTLLV